MCLGQRLDRDGTSGFWNKEEPKDQLAAMRRRFHILLMHRLIRIPKDLNGGEGNVQDGWKVQEGDELTIWRLLLELEGILEAPDDISPKNDKSGASRIGKQAFRRGTEEQIAIVTSTRILKLLNIDGREIGEKTSETCRTVQLQMTECQGTVLSSVDPSESSRVSSDRQKQAHDFRNPPVHLERCSKLLHYLEHRPSGISATGRDSGGTPATSSPRTISPKLHWNLGSENKNLDEEALNCGKCKLISSD